MKIAEIFTSIQGEGKLTGLPSVFVRTSGCNLRCTWCDTPYASWHPEGDDLTIDAVVEKIRAAHLQHVVLTGGEPMIQPQLPQLITRLKAQGHHVTVETAGSVWQDVKIDLASISPKLSNSRPPADSAGNWAALHEERRINLQALRAYAASDHILDRQWKFVVSQPADLQEIDLILSQIGSVAASDVILMPEGITEAELKSKAQWITSICQERNFRFGTRLHIWLYGNRRST